MYRPRTLYEKLVDNHTVRQLDATGNQVLLYIDRTVLNEYTSPQAFTGLREAGRRVWRPNAALGTIDQVNPTAPDRTAAMPDEQATRQAAYFAQNCRKFGIELLDVLNPDQGTEHVAMPEQGLAWSGPAQSSPRATATPQLTARSTRSASASALRISSIISRL